MFNSHEAGKSSKVFPLLFFWDNSIFPALTLENFVDNSVDKY